MAGIKKASVLRAVNEAIFFTSSALVALVTFATHVGLQRRSLTNQQLFTTLGLFNVVQFSMTKFFMLAVEYCSSAYVSLQRLQAFLELEDVANCDDDDNDDDSNNSSVGGEGEAIAAIPMKEIKAMGDSLNGGHADDDKDDEDTMLSIRGVTATWDDVESEGATGCGGGEGGGGGGGGGAAAPPIPIGAYVELRGLQAKPELNGQRGVVMGFNASTGRCSLKLEDGRGPFKIKIENLEVSV